MAKKKRPAKQSTGQTGNRPRRALDRSTWQGELGARIRERRDACGYTLYQAAERAGISHSLLQRVEIAKTNPSLETLIAIAQALAVHPAELLDGIRFEK